MSDRHQRTCYKQDVFVPRIESALGVSMGRVRCFIVDQQGMSKVMGRVGWSRNETHGVVGFQVDDEIFVLDGAPWTTLHELVHRAGINADRLNRFVAEGLTEVVAEQLRESADEHRPTYPQETTWIKQSLLPMLEMGAVELGRILARSVDPPRTLAELIARRGGRQDVTALQRDLQPQRPERPAIVGLGSATKGSRAILSSSSRTEVVGGLLLVAGLALSLPFLIERSTR